MFIHTEDEAIVLWRAYKAGGEAGALKALRQFTPHITASDEERSLGWMRMSFAQEMTLPTVPRHKTERSW